MMQKLISHEKKYILCTCFGEKESWKIASVLSGVIQALQSKKNNQSFMLVSCTILEY